MVMTITSRKFIPGKTMDWRGKKHLKKFNIENSKMSISLHTHRHNNGLYALLSAARPTFLQFWTMIEDISREKLSIYNEVRQEKAKFPKRKRFEITVVPGS